MSVNFQTNPDVIRWDWPRGGNPPKNLAMQRGLGGFPHERLHQDKVLWQQQVLGHYRNEFPWNLRGLQRTPLRNLRIAQTIKGVHRVEYGFTRTLQDVLNGLFVGVWSKF